MEVQTSDLKKGFKIEIEGKVYAILKADFTNPGKGSAFTKCRIKNLETGQVIERTFKSGVSTGATVPDLLEREVEYMYEDPEGFNFMDQSNYESIHVNKEAIGELAGYFQEGIKVYLLYFNGKPINVEVPTFVELVVKETDPGLKGDTATGGLKKAIMETGLQVNVPLFIKEGELLKIDTRTGEYVERVNK